MPRNFNLQDATLLEPAPLPASTTPTATGGLNLSTDSHSDFVAQCEFILTVPALTTAQLPDGKTMTYSAELAAPSDRAFGSPSTLYTLGTQTGAGGAGAAAIGPFRFRLPSTAQGYVRCKATPAASGTGDASGAQMTLTAVF
jgi:hypothetical protein